MTKQEQRKQEMLEMKKQRKTNLEIGKHFGLSKERVRQITVDFGFIRTEKIKIICSTCKKVFEDYASQHRIYCSHKCSAFTYRLTPEKPISEYTKEENSAMYKIRNEKTKETRRLYYQRPEVKQRVKEYHRTEKYKNYQREYEKRKRNK